MKIFSPRPRLRVLLLGSMPVILGACTTVGGVRPSEAAPRPAEPETVPVVESTPAYDAQHGRTNERIATRVVEIAVESIGTPYRWGGTGANGFDCSGLIQFAYGEVGIGLPRTSTSQLRAGFAVTPKLNLLLPGDVLGFSGAGSGASGHVGLYIGAGEFIHSSSSGVRISTLRNAYWEQRLVAARRMVQ